jgi:uncharacterized protein (DUF2164 family)
VTFALDDDRRQQLVEQIQAFHRERFDEELSSFRAAELLEYVLAAVGPQVYNQAVQDARKYMQQKLEDLDGDVYAPEGP